MAGAGAWLLPSVLVMGSLAALAFNTIPPFWLLGVAATGGLLALRLAPFRWLAAALLACTWSLWNFQLRLNDRLEPGLSGTVMTVRGVIASLPQVFDDVVSFRFQPLDDDTASISAARLPRTILVRWYEEWPELSPGQVWQLELVLKPPWGPVNFQGPDREKWLFASGIGGVGTVREGTLKVEQGQHGKRLVALRDNLFREIGQSLGGTRAAGIVQALAVADRSGIGRDERRQLALTGTSHLLAISGLHIGLAAAGGMLVTRGLGWFLPLAAMGSGFRLLGLGGGAAAAIAYAALAGFGVPTLRSLVMVLVAMATISASRSIHPGRAWLLAMAVVLLTNPFAALSAGFWFSFMAVAALLWFFVPRRRQRGWWRTPLQAQGAVLLVLLPFSAVWFQAFSVVGFAANLVAIPLVSFGVVPFVLAGVVVSAVSSPLAVLAWSIANSLSDLLLWFLEFMAAIQGEMTFLSTPSRAAALLALLGAFVLLLPRGVPGRCGGLFLLAPLFLQPVPRVEVGDVSMEVLDVGQGTAVMVRAAGHTLLYDSGPGDGAGRDMVSRAIVPAILHVGGSSPDRVVISHGDQDHAGGLWSLQARYPSTTYNANLAAPDAGLAGCHAPMKWFWRSTLFEILHPSGALPYQGNDSSCVIAIDGPGGRILLSGDISATVEARLLLHGLEPSDVLLVPHHGSRTSSSKAFLDALNPRLAVVTASLGNRFGFPRPETRQRYETARIPFWSTGECGAMRIMLHRDGRLDVSSARLSRPAIWRWPAADGCPDGSTLPGN